MFETLWGGLRKKLGAHTQYPAPSVSGTESAERLKRELEEFCTDSNDRFRRFFLKSRPLLIEAPDVPRFEMFEGAGLALEETSQIYVPCVRIFPLDGALIATDLRTHVDADQVFPLIREQIYIAAQMGVRKGDRALELCVGSGVNCLFLSDVAASVTGVELSPRAIEFAQFNVALNPGTAAVELRQGSLFEPLAADEKFDLVLVNPPFEPVPPGADYFLHSGAGEDGLDVVRQVLAKVHAHLAPGGRLEMYTWSPGNDTSVLVVELLRNAFPDRRIEVHFVDDLPLDDRIKRFRSEKGFSAWRQRLIAAGHTRIWDVYVRVDAEGPAEIVPIEHPHLLDDTARILEQWN